MSNQQKSPQCIISNLKSTTLNGSRAQNPACRPKIGLGCALTTTIRTHTVCTYTTVLHILLCPADIGLLLDPHYQCHSTPASLTFVVIDVTTPSPPSCQGDAPFTAASTICPHLLAERKKFRSGPSLGGLDLSTASSLVPPHTILAHR
jgi:beta-lactamase class A